MQIYLDNDGVICDFIKGCEKIFPNYPKTPIKPLENLTEHMGISTKEFWQVIDSYGEEFWYNLQPEPWAEELVEIISFYDPNFKILTSPSRSHCAASGKILWLQKFFKSKKFHRYIITPAINKQLLANKKSVLIDDNDRNCEEFISKLGYAVLFPRINNTNHLLEDQKLEYTKRQLQIIKQYI